MLGGVAGALSGFGRDALHGSADRDGPAAEHGRRHPVDCGDCGRWFHGSMTISATRDGIRPGTAAAAGLLIHATMRRRVPICEMMTGNGGPVPACQPWGPRHAAGPMTSLPATIGSRHVTTAGTATSFPPSIIGRLAGVDRPTAQVPTAPGGTADLDTAGTPIGDHQGLAAKMPWGTATAETPRGPTDGTPGGNADSGGTRQERRWGTTPANSATTPMRAAHRPAATTRPPRDDPRASDAAGKSPQATRQARPTTAGTPMEARAAETIDASDDRPRTHLVEMVVSGLHGERACSRGNSADAANRGSRRGSFANIRDFFL